MRMRARGAGRLAAILAAGVLVAGLAGCTDKKRATFEGHVYKARLSAERGDDRAFTVTISPVSQGLKGAREAGRYEAVKYCIRRFGKSKMSWEVGPDSPEEALAIVDDTLTLSGRCTVR